MSGRGYRCLKKLHSGCSMFESERAAMQIAESCRQELTLAKEMGVSRTLIRDCLSALEREGFISRKHGVGTIVNPHILNATTRMEP